MFSVFHIHSIGALINSYKHRIKLVISTTIMLSMLIISGCTEVVDIDVKPGRSQLTIDGWIYDNADTQTIKFSMSHAFFDTMPAPTAKGVANVVVTDEGGTKYSFEETIPGSGIFQSAFTGEIGKKYTLTFNWEKERYVAKTSLNRVPPIDSLLYQFREKSLGEEAGYSVLFYANDLPGLGDFYRFKVYRKEVGSNEYVLYNRANQIYPVNDADTDGLLFIYPNRRYFDREPYNLGDAIITVVESIDEPAFNFLIDIVNQANNVGLFASTVTNARTNIINLNSSSEEKAVGWFGASAVSSDTIVIGEPGKERSGRL